MFWQLNPAWTIGLSRSVPRERESLRQLPRGHIPALDAIRGLAILLVTVYRFGGGAHGPARALESGAWIDWGARGVDLFFVLSGFLITGLLVDLKHQPHYFRNFYARRTLRIFPLYYGVLIGLLVASFLPLAADGPFRQAFDHQAWLWFYGANAVQSAYGDWCLGPLDHFWSLAVEEHFYLLWPLVIFALPSRAAQHFCLGLVACSFFGRLIWLGIGGNDVTIYVLTPFRMDGLAIGAWVALAAREDGGLPRLVNLARRAFWVTAPLVFCLAMTDRRLMGMPHTIWSCFFAAFLILTVVARPSTILARLGNSRPLQFFGKYSYGMYVFQCLLIPLLAPVWTAPWLAERLGSPVLGQLLYFVVMFSVTTCMAVVSWHLYERPFLSWKSYFESQESTLPRSG